MLDTLHELRRSEERKSRQQGVIFRQISNNRAMDTISPVYARLVLRELERRTIDPSSLFADTALTRRSLLRGGDIAVEDFVHILRTGDQLLGDNQLGFILGQKTHVFAMGEVGGGLALAAVPLVARYGQGGSAMPDPDQLVWQVFATAGFAGGFVYWLLAGRNA